MQEKVALALASGSSLTAAAAEAGLNRVTIYRWLKTNLHFSAAVQQARAEFMLARRDDLHYLSSRAMETLLAILDNPRSSPAVLLRASMFILQRSETPGKGWCMPASLPEPELLETTDIPEPASNEMQHETQCETPYADGALPSCPVPAEVRQARDSHAYYQNVLDDLKTIDLPAPEEQDSAEPLPQPRQMLATCPVPASVLEARGYRSAVLNTLDEIKTARKEKQVA